MVVTWAYNAGTNTATASGAGSTNFADLVAADTAGGWGKYTADATGTQIKLQGKIVIGDGSNATAFTDTDKQVVAVNALTSDYSRLIDVKTSSTMTWGQVISSTDKTSGNGVQLIYQDNYYANIFCDGGIINFYSSSVVGTQKWISAAYGADGCKFWNSKLQSIRAFGNCDVYNVHSEGSPGQGGQFKGSNTIDKLSITDTAEVGTYISSGATITNLFMRNAGTTSFACDGVAADRNLVNPDVDVWSVIWSVTGTIYRQYTFDLVTETSAAVVLKNSSGTEVFNVTSNAVTGVITQQTVTRGYYNQANGNTLQDYGPFTLTISKAGYATYTHTGIVLDEKIDWRISLLTTAEAQALVPSTGGRGAIIYRDREVIKRVEVPTKKEKIALQLCGVLIAQKENMRRQNSE